MPKKDGVIRVDNYWCHSTFLHHLDDMTATASGDLRGGSSSINDDEISKKCKDKKSNVKEKPEIDRPGTRYVTIFCDDQKMPLPRTVVDMISRHAEKMVPGSIGRLNDAAKVVQLKIDAQSLKCK